MNQIYEKIINTYYYATESVKNRYPCKIIRVDIANDLSPSEIKYSAASKINIRQARTKDILDDPLLVEKFHPTDCIKLGFLAFGEIVLNQNTSIEHAKNQFLEIVNKLFSENIN